MFAVIKLGGCNGSGKTTIAREIIELAEAVPESVPKKEAHLLGQWKDMRIAVLGRYETACGGMDTISDKNDRLALLEELRSSGAADIIFFEGLITGKTYGAMGALSEADVAEECGRWLYAMMDTPFDVCVERVLKRRADAGNLNPFDPERTMRSTFKSTESLMRKLTDGTLPAHPTHWIRHDKKPRKEAKKLLTLAREMYHESF